MSRCPSCGGTVETLHPVPPELITQSLIDRLAGEQGDLEPEVCASCLDDLSVDSGI